MPRVIVILDRNLEALLRPPRRGLLEVSVPTGASVLTLIEDLGIPRTEIRGLAVDGRSVPPGFHPAEGSRIDASGVVTEPCFEPPRFILDVHLGRLARLLRLLGFDTTWSREATDAALAACSSREGRILLSRDRGLLKRRELRQGCLVRSQSSREQVTQIVARYALRGLLSPFSRCLVCNSPLEYQVHGESRGTPRAAGRCTGCGRRYWRGSHWEAMRIIVEEIRGRI
jgi:uncharacterized protein